MNAAAARRQRGEDSPAVPDSDSEHAASLYESHYKLMSAVKSRPVAAAGTKNAGQLFLRGRKDKSQARSKRNQSQSFLRAGPSFQPTDRELLDRLRGFRRDPGLPENQDDVCGCYMADIATMLGDKLEELLSRKFEKKEEKSAMEENLAKMAAELSKAVAKAKCAEKELAGLRARSQLETEETVKFDRKIGEIDEQIGVLRSNGSKKMQTKQRSLDVGLKEYEKTVKRMTLTAGQEKAELEDLLRKQETLQEELDRKDDEFQTLKAQVDGLREKEAGRQQTFKSVANVIDVSKKRRPVL